MFYLWREFDECIFEIIVMSIFVTGFWLLCLICAAVFFKSKQLVKFSTDDNFKRFQKAYLAVYLLATGRSG